MRFLILTLACLAMSLSAAAPNTADAQGPVRRGIRASVGLTPERPNQARPGANLSDADRGRDARWRFQQHNGDWWYYTPNNVWMYQREGEWQRFAEDTFTPNPQYQAQGQYAGDVQQTVFIDSGGRAVMCRDGQIVFTDGTALRSVPRNQVNQQGYIIGQTNVQGQFAPAQPVPGQANFNAASQAQFQQGVTVQPSQNQAGAQASGQVNPQTQPQDSQGQVNAQGQPQSGTPPAPTPAPDESESN